MKSKANFSITLTGSVHLNGLPKEALEGHIRRGMEEAIGKGLITGYTEAMVDEFQLTVSATKVDPEDEDSVPNFCPNCGADLTQVESVDREYANKQVDEDNVPLPSVYALGHYKDGVFEADRFNGFESDSSHYDVLDDSDTCVNCEHHL